MIQYNVTGEVRFGYSFTMHVHPIMMFITMCIYCVSPLQKLYRYYPYPNCHISYHTGAESNKSGYC